MPLTPRQKATARRNQELRDLANQIARVEQERDDAQALCSKNYEHAQRLHHELAAVESVPIEAVRAVIGSLPIGTAVKLDVVEECIAVHRWLEAIDRSRRARPIHLADVEVSTGNGVR